MLHLSVLNSHSDPHYMHTVLVWSGEGGVHMCLTEDGSDTDQPQHYDRAGEVNHLVLIQRSAGKLMDSAFIGVHVT